MGPSMDILYLCGSNVHRQYAIRHFTNDNQDLIDKVVINNYTIHMKNGTTLFFHTYSRPEQLRGMTFQMVLRDHNRIEATMAQQHETEEIVRYNLGKSH